MSSSGMRNIMDLIEGADRIGVAQRRIKDAVLDKGIEYTGTNYYGDDAFVMEFRLAGADWIKHTGQANAAFSVDIQVNPQAETFSVVVHATGDWSHTPGSGLSLGTKDQDVGEMVPVVDGFVDRFLAVLVRTHRTLN